MRHLLVVAVFLGLPAWAVEPLSADFEGLATTLASSARINVSGEEAHFIPRDAAIPLQYDTFMLKFDRASKRLRLTYSRFLDKSMRIDVDAWGTLDCLNTLRVERTPPAFVSPKMQSCIKFDSLYSVLSENAAGYSPNPIMRGEIESTLVAAITQERNTDVTLGHERGMRVMKGVYRSPQKEIGYNTLHEWKYGFNEAGTQVLHIAVDDSGGRSRANYKHTDAAFADSDFSFVPDPELIILVDFNKSPNDPARAALENAAAKGSLTARLALAIREPTAAGMAYGIGLDDPERAWDRSTELAKLGVAGMYTAQGQLLARMPAHASQYLPKQFRTMTADQRKLEAAKLVWKGAQACDPQALEEAGKGLMMGGDIFDPNVLKQNELATITRACDKKMTAPQLLTAADHFKLPWP